MESENQVIEKIDLMPIIRRTLKNLRKLWILILVLSLLGGAAFYLRARMHFTEQYTAKSLLSVNSGYSGGSARMEEECTLDDVCAAAGWAVKNGGRFAIVHRPERLVDLFCALRQYDMEPKRMRFVQARDLPPSAVLVEAYKQGKPGLVVYPPEVRE